MKHNAFANTNFSRDAYNKIGYSQYCIIYGRHIFKRFQTISLAMSPLICKYINM